MDTDLANLIAVGDTAIVNLIVVGIVAIALSILLTNAHNSMDAMGQMICEESDYDNDTYDIEYRDFDRDENRVNCEKVPRDEDQLYNGRKIVFVEGE